MTESERIPIKVATDVSMAFHTQDPSTLFRAALVELLAAVSESVIGANPTIIAAAVAKVNEVLASESIVTSAAAVTGEPGNYMFLADKFGNLSKIGTDEYGEVAEDMMLSIVGKGGLRAVTVPGLNEIALLDEHGHVSAMSINASTGIWSDRAYWAMANKGHAHTGPNIPDVYPGNWILWTRTSADGTEILEYIHVREPAL